MDIFNDAEKETIEAFHSKLSIGDFVEVNGYKGIYTIVDIYIDNNEFVYELNNGQVYCREELETANGY